MESPLIAATAILALVSETLDCHQIAAAEIGCSGMRGVVTVAVVQTLPVSTHDRSALILIASTAVVATLLLSSVR